MSADASRRWYVNLPVEEKFSYVRRLLDCRRGDHVWLSRRENQKWVFYCLRRLPEKMGPKARVAQVVT